MSSSRRWIALAVAGSLAGALALAGRSSHPELVQRLEWTLDKPFGELLARRGVPVILRGASTDLWPAHQRWDNAHLGSVVPTVEGVYAQAGSVFGPFFDPSRPLASLATVRPRHNYSAVEMPMQDLLRVLEAPVEGQWLYLSTELSPLLEPELTPLGELLLDTRSSVNLWIGQEGVTAPCHYDGYHNFVVQVLY